MDFISDLHAAGVLDTSIVTQNTGDHIIMEACWKELREVLLSRQIISFPTHEKMSSASYKLQKNVEFNIACGTNLLHSHMGLIKQWNVGFLDTFKLKPVVLLGVGWRSQEKRKTDIYTRWLLRNLLSTSYMHSVRDSYAKRKLNEIGIDNVLNTGCPTTWSLNREHCKKIPVKKGDNAVMVLTDYSKDIELDTALVDLVLTEYKKVYFWCQGLRDYAYLEELGIKDKVNIIPSSLYGYHKLLADKSISLDYVGTRLHGGIYALQHKRRSVIIGVDHRANKKGMDFNLPVIDRYVASEKIESMVMEDFQTRIDLPVDEINKWKSQFIK